MGRKLDAFLNRGFRAPKCLTLLKLSLARIKLVKNKKTIAAAKARKEIARSLQTGKESHVYIMAAPALIREENFVQAFDLIEQFCQLVINRLPMIEAQRECPLDIKEAVTSLIFAAPRCSDLDELMHIRDMFTAKYGKDFTVAAAELRPDCGVNKEIIEKLSTRPPTGQMKLKIMKEIAAENNIDWTPQDEMASEDLLDGSSHFLQENENSQAEFSKQDKSKKPVDAGDSKVETVIPAFSTVGSSSKFGNSETPGAASANENLSHSSKHDTPQDDEPSTSEDLDPQEARESGLHDDSVDMPRSSGLTADDEELSDTESDLHEETFHDGEENPFASAEMPASAAPMSSEASKPAAPEEEEALGNVSSVAPTNKRNPQSEKQFITVTSFSGKRREYKDFASAAKAAFESAALAAEAAQAAIDLAKLYAEPGSTGRDANRDKTFSDAGEQKQIGKTGSGLSKNVFGDIHMDRPHEISAHMDRPHESGNRPHEFEENEDEKSSSNDDDDFGGDLNRMPSTANAAEELETNPVSFWNAAPTVAELPETSTNESVVEVVGRPKFDDDDFDDDASAGHFARHLHAAEARLSERFKQRFAHEHVESPFVDEIDVGGALFGRRSSSGGGSFGRRREEVTLNKPQFDEPKFVKPQFDKPKFDKPLFDGERIQEIHRQQEESYMSVGESTKAESRGGAAVRAAEKLSGGGGKSSDQRKLRWNASEETESVEGMQKQKNSRYGESRRSTKSPKVAGLHLAEEEVVVEKAPESDGLHQVAAESDGNRGRKEAEMPKGSAFSAKQGISATEFDGNRGRKEVEMPKGAAFLAKQGSSATELDGNRGRKEVEIPKEAAFLAKQGNPASAPPPRRPPPPLSAPAALASSASDPVIAKSTATTPPPVAKPISATSSTTTSALSPPPPLAKKLASAAAAPAAAPSSSSTTPPPAPLARKLISSTSAPPVPAVSSPGGVVHPKLPDYDNLVAHFAALKNQRSAAPS